jgi:hypothetical protein
MICAHAVRERSIKSAAVRERKALLRTCGK